MQKKKIIFFVTVAVLVVAFAVSAFMVVNYIAEGKRQEDMYAQLRAESATATAATEAPTVPEETAAEETAETTEATEETEPTEPQILPEMQSWYDKNPDTVGYIELPGEQGYPVVQTPGNRDYYLTRDFEGKNSPYGTIYAELADINEPSDNITLYGHNMKNGAMFGNLDLYQKKSYWEENQYFYFNTLYERHLYRVFAVFKTNADVGQGWDYHLFIDAENEEDFNNFVNTAKYGRTEGGKVVSFYDTDVTPIYGDKLITLSTCEYTMGQNGRLVVCAVRWA